jgi:hypothetical protein
MSSGAKLTNQAGMHISPHNTIYGEIYDFFSLRNMIELFGCDDTHMFVLELQAFCAANTDQTITHLSSSQYDLVINNTAFLESFNDHKFFSVSDLESTELMHITKSLTQSMESSYGESGEDTDAVRRFYPDLSDLITDYEVSVMEDDGSLADQLSTPDTKLYYPEPFIASPSFVHEDLWFIHILHYQH